MKVSQLSHIPDSLSRFVQSSKFLRSVELTAQAAREVRDQAVLELRDQGFSQSELAKMVGVTQQMISFAEKRARNRKDKQDEVGEIYESDEFSIDPPWIGIE